MSFSTARTVRPKDRSQHGHAGWHRRLMRAGGSFFFHIRIHAGVLFRRIPWWQRLLMLGTLLALAVAAIIFLNRYRERERVKEEIRAEWKSFDRCADTLDTAGMIGALDAIDRIKADEPLARRRRESLKRGDADQDDQVMIVYWVNRYISEDRIPDAAREARKRIENVADDWQANCVLAHNAFRESVWNAYRTPALLGPACAVALKAWRADKIEEAHKYMKQLPSPLAGRHPIGIGGIKYGFFVHRLVGYDDSALRSCRHDLVIPNLRNPDITSQPTGLLIELLEMYLNALTEDIGSFADLPSYWVGSSRVAQFLVEDSSVTTAQLIRLGDMQERQLQILVDLVRKKYLTAEKARPFEDELRERLAELWAKALVQDPKSPQALMGMASAELRAGRLDSAMKILNAGEDACTDQKSRLAMVHSRYQLLRKFSAPGYALEKMDEIAQRYPDQPAILHMQMECAKAAGRLDRVLEICDQARKINPDLIWPLKEEARVHIDQDRQAKAFAALGKCQSLLIRDAEITELFVRAYALAGASYEIKPLLDRVGKEVVNASQACPPLRAALQAGYVEEAAAVAAIVAKRFPQYHKDLLLIVGDSQLQLAQPKSLSDQWNSVALRAASRAYESIEFEEPGNLEVVHSLTYLLLNGFNAFNTADRSAEPLREAYRAGNLPPRMLDTLGGVELSRGRYDEARRILQKAVREQPTASAYVHLALTCYYLNILAEAQQALKNAGSLPRSPYESKELKQAISIIDGTKS